MNNSGIENFSGGVTRSGPVTSNEPRTKRDGATLSHPVTGKAKNMMDRV
jgi:hypothetical protein